ncbi:signal peptidase I [Microterricola viridarii]|uniref:Signal peptidase I n=1 Tax=Microterricola viridarii TaxID=412690 RepID=A0A1H1Z3R8_9MICO|nr:signal peptidase I [Microterricola viridarii]SDT27816.1 signal peptidase, endoplasmic reticulum-type [Microterricola viridarii]
MRALRSLGNIVLWILAALGVAAGALWLANSAGLVQPLIVVSGSMEPGIMTGDLLFSTQKDAAELRVGDVTTLPSTLTGKMVTHRVIEVTPSGTAGEYVVRMQGDNNVFPDSQDYLVSGSVLVPSAQITGGGYVLATVSKPGVVIPLTVTVLALVGLSLLPRSEGASSLEQPASTNEASDDPLPLSAENSEARA